MIEGLKMWQKLYPAIQRRWLFAIAGIIWSVVGGLLCLRAIGWLATLSLYEEVFLEIAGVVLAVIGYVYMFSRIVQKNINRIHTLPNPVCAFAFTTWSGYAMIGLMVTIGIMLRNSSIPKNYLTVPYTVMGGMLLIGGARFLRLFVVILSRER